MSPTRIIERASLVLISVALLGAVWGLRGLSRKIEVRLIDSDTVATPRTEPEHASEQILLDELERLEARNETRARELEDKIAQFFDHLSNGMKERESAGSAALEMRIESLDHRLMALGTTLKSVTECAVDVVPENPIQAVTDSAPISPAPSVVPDTHSLSFADLLKSTAATAASEAQRRTRFTMVAGGCKVGFDGKSTLHDFSGSTDRVDGELLLRMSDPANDPGGKLIVDAKSLKTGNSSRDSNMHQDHLQSETFETIEFAIQSIRDVEPGQERDFTAIVSGTLHCHGRNRDIDVPVVYQKVGHSHLRVRGEWKMKMSDFGIEPPTALGGMIQTTDEVTAWFVLQLKSDGSSG